MTKILILDVETTGLDFKKDSIIEIGAVLCDWNSQKPIHIQSSNIVYDGELDQKIIDLTGIENYMLKAPLAVSLKSALIQLIKRVEFSDYLAAHNAKFDFNFILEACDKFDLKFPNKPIIDTRYDLPFKADQGTFKLNYLLSDHGTFNPFAHRAVFDCLSLFNLMKCYELKDILELQKSEMVTLKANVGFKGKDDAKRFGFFWNPHKKAWLLDVKKARLRKLKDHFPFRTQIEYEIPFGEH